MHVDVYSRKQIIEDIQPDPSTCLISTTTPTIGSPLLDPQYEYEIESVGWFAILRLQFHDAVTYHYPEITLFDDQMAKQTIDFIKQHAHLNFAVHCDAGKSRSVAIGRFISETYGHTLTVHESQVAGMYNSMSDRPKGNSLVVQQLFKHNS